MADCGCKVINGGTLNQARYSTIKFCALHANAGNLRDERDKLLRVLETRAAAEMKMLEGVARENDKLKEALEPLIPKDDVAGMSGSDLLTHVVKVRDVRAARAVFS